MSRPFCPRAVVFDLDGTLLDSLSLVLESIAHAIAPYGGRPTREIFGHLGGPPERFLAALVPDLTHVPVAVARMEAYHRANVHLIRPFGGAEELVRELRMRGMRLGIWTGRDRLSTGELLREHRWEDHFDAIVCGDDLPTHKPDPQGLQRVLTQLGIAPLDTLFVGDADVDVLGGSACGVNTLLIRHTRQMQPEILRQAWDVVASPAEAYARVRATLEGANTGCIERLNPPIGSSSQGRIASS